jgi:gas vesicle protein
MIQTKGGAFLKGVGIGVAAGVAIAMASVPRERKSKDFRRCAGKTLRSIGEAIENLF